MVPSRAPVSRRDLVEPWIAPLVAGDPEAAWDLFLERYRRLIFGAIRHRVEEADDVMDVFAHICEVLRQKDFARLRRCAGQADPNRPLSTWLVVVVHNLTIDWLRHRDGRPRVSAVAGSLPLLRQRIFEYVFVQQRSHVEAYEILCTRDNANLAFGEFLKELSATYRAAGDASRGRILTELASRPPHEVPEAPDEDPLVLAERQALLAAAMKTLPEEDRLAVQLYVVDGMPAEQVGRALGFPNAKAVYNRVYRALAALRTHLERVGVRGAQL